MPEVTDDIGEEKRGEDKAPSYEELIRSRAAASGLEVAEERGGLRLTDAARDRSSWHRLGGLAEEQYEARVRPPDTASDDVLEEE